MVKLDITPEIFFRETLWEGELYGLKGEGDTPTCEFIIALYHRPQ